MKLKLHNILIALFVLSGLGIIAVMINNLIQTSALNIPLIINIIFGMLLGADALLFFLVAWGLHKKTKWAFTMGLILVAINILALIFDDFGLADALAALFNVLLGALLIIDKNR